MRKERLPSFAVFYLVLSSFTGFYLVLPSLTGFYLVESKWKGRLHSFT